MKVEYLREAGIDYERGVQRFMGDAVLYEKALHLFAEDATLEQAEAAMKVGDEKGLFACVHEVKGTSGNMDMADLYRAACQLVSLLRIQREKREPYQLEQAFAAFEKEYVRVCRGIRLAKEA